MTQQFYGYFENAQDATPAHEPPRDCPCLYCGNPVNADDVRTHNVMWSTPQYAKRSYFYWTHRTCAEQSVETFAYQGGTDGFILDMIARNGD